MRIKKLLSATEFETLLTIGKTLSGLTLENTGYQYINVSSLTADESKGLARVNEILRNTIDLYAEFFNFRQRGETVQLRFNYGYSYRFTGVGYAMLEELYLGFDSGFDEWFKSDNVIKKENGLYSTQCAQWKNALTYAELVTYFKKEYL